MKIVDYFSEERFENFRDYCRANRYIDLEDLSRFSFRKLLKKDEWEPKTIQKIEEKLQEYIDQHAGNWKIIHTARYELTNLEVNGIYLRKLPIFNARETDLKIEELHPSYCVDERIEYLLLPLRAKNILDVLNIDKIGDILMLTAEDLFQNRNCGIKTIENIRQTLKKYLLITSKDLKLNWKSFNSLLYSLVDIGKRDYKILKNRLGIGYKKILTLEKAGTKFDLTRERTRQILDNIFDQIKDNPAHMLEPIWKEIDNYIEQYFGLVNYDVVSDKVYAALNWNKKQPGHILAEFALHSTDKYFVDHKFRGICFKDDDCILCDDFSKALFDMIQAKGKISIEDASKNMLQYCLIKHKTRDKKYLDSSLIMHFVSRLEDIRITEKYFYSEEAYKEKLRINRMKRMRNNNPVYELTEKVLIDAGEALKSHEIERRLYKINKSVKFRLPEIIHYCDKIHRWGWGKYIHRRFIPHPDELIDKIYSYIFEKLQTDIPFLSVHNVFKKFEKECIEAGISTEISLYTIMKLIDDKRLVQAQFPIIFAVEKYNGQTMNSVLIEYFKNNKNVDYHTSYDYFIRQIGLKKETFQWFIAKHKIKSHFKYIQQNIIKKQNLDN